MREAGIDGRDGVIEIGSGPGNLTERLAGQAGHVWAFEIDPELHELAIARPNVTLFNVDGADFEEHVRSRRRIKVVSNLPYSDYRRILLKLLETGLRIESYTLLVQRDVFDRWRAKPGTKDYGPDSVLIRYTCALRLLRRAGRMLFYPRPRVESALVRLVRKRPVDVPRLDAGLRDMFAHRRKKFGWWLRRKGIQAPRLADLRVGDLAPDVLAPLALDESPPV